MKIVFKIIGGKLKIISYDFCVTNFEGRTFSSYFFDKNQPKIKKLKENKNSTEFKLYKTWSGFKQRCFNSKNKSYSRYGGRGITVSKKWMNFDYFKEDMLQSYIEHLEKFGSKNTSLDRIDNNGNYCKKNCKWSTNEEQQNNRILEPMRKLTFNGKTLYIRQWANILNIPYARLNSRFHRNYPVEDILSTENFKKGRPIREKDPT